MADVLITLDRERRLKYDINALADAEAALGKSISKAMGDDAGFRDVRALLWAALHSTDKSLSQERVGTLMTNHLQAGGTLEELLTKIAEAFVDSRLFGTAATEGNEGNA